MNTRVKRWIRLECIAVILALLLLLVGLSSPTYLDTGIKILEDHGYTEITDATLEIDSGTPQCSIGYKVTATATNPSGQRVRVSSCYDAPDRKVFGEEPIALPHG